MPENPEITKLQRWLSKHFVSLVLNYWHLDKKGNSKGKPIVCANSGFIMSFGELWFYMTAGHVIQDLDELIAEKYVKVVDAFLIDLLGSQATHQDNIPFTYEDSPRHGVYEDGLDFGFVGIDVNTKRLLQANGIEPIAIQNWTNVDIDRCFSFALLGIPAELVKPQKQDGRQGIWIGTIINSVKRLKRAPNGSKTTKYKRFVGKITKPNELQSMKGVSGGPIIGFYMEGEDTRYWVVAVQSHAIEKKYIFGCPVKLIGNIMLDQFKALVEHQELRAEA